MASHLASGFDALTLDPSPRLRQTQTRLQQRNYFLEARQVLSQAMTEAIEDLEGTASNDYGEMPLYVPR